jgi:hypothetical protein
LIAGASASALGLLVNSNSNPALVCISSAIFGPALLVGISGLICIGKFDLKIPITPEYFRNQRAIGLLREPESLLAPSIGHEYDHHVTETTLEFANMTRENETPTFNIVKEGHARGVERHIAAYYAEKTSQSDFIEPTLRLTLGELSAAYMWLSDKLHIPSNTSALDINNVHYYNEIQFVDKLGRPSKHAIGNTLFCLAEAKQGKGIYADFVKGDFDFINKSFSA